MKVDISTPCMVALGLFGASLYTTIRPCFACSKLEASFDETQIKIYKEIVTERLYDYYIGLIIGIIVAILFYNFYGKHSDKNGANKIMLCVYLIIVLFSQCLYYMLVPKSKYMLEYLRGDQIGLWLDTYKNMKTNYLLGAILGIIAYIVLAYGYSSTNGNRSISDAISASVSANANTKASTKLTPVVMAA